MQNIYAALIVTLCSVICPITVVSIATWSQKPQSLFKDSTASQRKTFTVLFTIAISLIVFIVTALHDMSIIFTGAHTDWFSFVVFALVLGMMAAVMACMTALPITAAITEPNANNSPAK